MASKLFIFLSFAFSTGIVLGQIEREGVPLSWTIGEDLVSQSVWEVLASPDISALIAEDLEQSDKSLPYRFAFAHSVNFTTENTGYWTNLRNGDRIWVLGIDCPNAFSIGLTLSNLSLPRGGKLYIYSEDRTDYLGPLTAKDNRNMPLGTPPIKGSKIIIEYYEPYAYRGQGDFKIQYVSRSYRDLKNGSMLQQSECTELLEITPQSGQLINASASVMMMLVDNGQRVATATLLNNTTNDAMPYALTSENALIGNPASWIFLFNVMGTDCLFGNLSCSSAAICGAYVVGAGEPNGISLLKLRSTPKNSWDAFYSGWRIGTPIEESTYTCVQHALGLPQSVAIYNGSLVSSTLAGKATLALNTAQFGTTSEGSIGSPLFDEEMNLIGIFVGGDTHCDEEGQDHYELLSSSWNNFKQYLDPFSIAHDRLEGLYPNFDNSSNASSTLEVFFFPNPAQNSIYVQNESDLPVNEIHIHDANGRLVKIFKPLIPTVDLENLPEGFYSISFISGNQIKTQSLLIR